MEPTQSEKSFPTHLELSKEGIPLVPHEGQKVESKQFRQLSELTDHEQAMKVYMSLKQLESGDFKDSKARDENGELMLVWHGSPRKFDEFNLDANGQWEWRNQGICFSSSKELVQQFADKARSGLKFAYNDILRHFEKVTPETRWNEEKFKKVAKVYNEIVEDLIENGEDSKCYHKGYRYDEKTGDTHFRDPSLDDIDYMGRKWGLWFLEIFGGKIPTKENTVLDDKFGYYGINVYRGNEIGAYKYLAVLNTTNPFKKQTHISNTDDGFEDGERSHEQNGTDGTILLYPNVGEKLKIDTAKELCSMVVFDPKQIRIIGREEDKKFAVTTPNSTT